MTYMKEIPFQTLSSAIGNTSTFCSSQNQGCVRSAFGADVISGLVDSVLKVTFFSLGES